MNTLGLRLRHLGFHGAGRVPATVEFGAGLNVIYGASETGKSFIVEAIDFMLGGKPPLRDIPQRVGYDRVILGAETLGGEEFTLSRSSEGGNFRAYSGLYLTPPGEEVESRELGDQHSDKNDHNLSQFLLERCGLAGRRVRKNRAGATISLSFRTLARLVIVTENEITQQRSPLSDGNPTADTSNFATFKLLLTGVDDSALSVNTAKAAEDQSREAQMELLDKLLGDYRDRLDELTRDPDDLADQLQRIQTAMSQQEHQLSTTEAHYREWSTRRRELRGKLEEAKDRRSEIGSLLERFALLERHYASDIGRLRGIEEGGTLFQVFGKAPCPLCGAPPEQHRSNADCDGNVDGVVAAARSEIAKIEVLRKELGDTVKGLMREAAGFDRRMPKLEEELRVASGNIERMISPALSKLRATYSQFADKRGEVREALVLFRTIQDIERRRAKLEKSPIEQNDSSVADGDLPASVADGFAETVESILKTWHFPEAERVYFEAKHRDLVIGAKLRTARGKGLRAITHAAFTLGLLDFCRSNGTAHPGFVVLDSPLLAYRAPEGSEDDLTGTDLNERFYDYLAALPGDRQVIIIENTDPPDVICQRPQMLMFSKNPHAGRYGFFPAG